MHTVSLLIRLKYDLLYYKNQVFLCILPKNEHTTKLTTKNIFYHKKNFKIFNHTIYVILFF